jgi:hypothetical protein
MLGSKQLQLLRRAAAAAAAAQRSQRTCTSCTPRTCRSCTTGLPPLLLLLPPADPVLLAPPIELLPLPLLLGSCGLGALLSCISCLTSAITSSCRRQQRC